MAGDSGLANIRGPSSHEQNQACRARALDVGFRSVSDLRDTNPIETAWAPPYVGDELRQVRAAAWDARLAGRRATAKRRRAAWPPRRPRTRPAGTSWPPVTRPWSGPTGSARRCSPRRWPTAPTGTPPPAPSASWPSPPRDCAVAHPGQYFPPLRSAEPEPATGAQRDDLALTPDEPPGGIDQWITELAAGHRTFAGQARRPAEPGRSRPKTPTTATSARRSPPGPDPAGSRSCSRRCPRSRPPRRSSSG